MEAEENAAGPRGGQGRMTIQGSGVGRSGGAGQGGQMVPVQNSG